MNELQSVHSNLSRGDDAIDLSQLEIPRLKSIKTDLPRSDPSSQNSTPRILTPNTPDIFFKTKLCNNFTNKGSCGYGDECTFAHGMEDLRSSWEARIRVCKMHMRSGKCTYGANCSYLHVETGEGSCVSAADKKRTGFCKTNPCFSWRTSGRCSYGAYCRFIHANEDSKKTGAGVEAEGGHKTEVLEGSSRSRSIFSFKPIVVPSRLKSGSEKLKEMKKVDGIYGDWLE
ncbi:Zinc finger CCCH domain-containing protein 39 [Carex littledalei]|uniref:Zinc finger CCCH domain-containing protein 39 n=1 Tax=Carex littledalei TaxID=544730 RepID=A0A833VDV6_9POAL|nr:Zinc finger CCCH domain-containing protein 39 [Carex littledalei]